MVRKLVCIIHVAVIFTLLIPAGGIPAQAKSTENSPGFQADSNQSTIFLPVVSRSPEIIQPVIPESTVPLSDESTSAMTVSESGSVFVFEEATPELKQVDIGDVIVGDPSTAAPDGFLRKVTGVIEQDN